MEVYLYKMCLVMDMYSMSCAIPEPSATMGNSTEHDNLAATARQAAGSRDWPSEVMEGFRDAGHLDQPRAAARLGQTPSIAGRDFIVRARP